MVGSRKRYIHQSRRNRARRAGAARGVTSGETASLFAPVAERSSPGSACVIVALLVVPSRVPVLEHPGSQIDLGILLDRLDGTVPLLADRVAEVGQPSLHVDVLAGEHRLEKVTRMGTDIPHLGRYAPHPRLSGLGRGGYEHVIFEERDAFGIGGMHIGLLD